MAAGVVLAVGMIGLIHLPKMWSPTANPTQRVLGVIEVYSPGTPTITAKTAFQQLLEAARGSCLQDRPFVVLGDDAPLYMLTDAYMYPRKIVRIRSDQPFERIAEEWRGGCIGAYRENVGRVESLRDQLEEIVCSEDGCVYRVK
jgi:hypothetical protein